MAKSDLSKEPHRKSWTQQVSDETPVSITDALDVFVQGLSYVFVLAYPQHPTGNALLLLVNPGTILHKRWHLANTIIWGNRTGCF